MSIRFNCPHCNKSLKVNAELAGKRARCPGCKQALTIPALDPVASAEVEELAAAALSDAPRPEARQEEQETGTIKFQCPFCDEAVEVGAELAGKQAPCPECRRIVKVPLPVKKEPRDWRKVTPRGPAAGLRRDEPPPPDGAWGTAVSSGAVSSQALIEAEAAEGVPLTPAQWARRGLVAAGVLLLLGAGAYLAMHLRGQSIQNKALRLALEAVPEKGNSPLDNLDAAELHRAVGEYFIRDEKALPARQHLAKAQARLSTQAAAAKTPSETDLAAVDLALTQADLFGTADEAREEKRVAWSDAAKEMRPTLRALGPPEARAEAVRQLTRKLIERGQPGPLEAVTNLAITFALHLGSDADRPEMLALVGLELARAGARGEAQAVADQALASYDPSLESRPPVAPPLVALLVALDQQQRAEAELRIPAPQPGAPNPPAEARLGYAVGWACLGKGEALQLADAPGSASERWQALVGVAAAAKDPETARAAVDAAAPLLDTDLKDRLPDGWSMLRLVRTGARVGAAERVRPVADRIPDAALRSRAQLDLLRSRLAPSTATDAEGLAAAGKDQANPLALELRARHHARYGNPSDALRAVGSWEPESLRPFGYVGVALGLQDAGK
jgi:hypothetical protein